MHDPTPTPFPARSYDLKVGGSDAGVAIAGWSLPYKSVNESARRILSIKAFQWMNTTLPPHILPPFALPASPPQEDRQGAQKEEEGIEKPGRKERRPSFSW